MSDLKERFNSAYANLPDALRGEIIAVVDDKPYTWNAIFFELNNNTERSEELLNTLSDLGIL